MNKTMQQLIDEATETIRAQTQRIRLLEAAIDRTLETLKAVQAGFEASADDVKDSTTVQWVNVIEVEAADFYSSTTRNRRAMWRLRTEDGRQVNLFDHGDPLRDNKPLLEKAGYLRIFATMDLGEIDRWTSAPIEVELAPDNSFWKVTQIKPRKTFAKADFIEEEPSEEELEFTDSALSRLIRAVKRGNFVILDTETTGLGSNAEICQIAIIDPTGKVLLDTFIKPVARIPMDAVGIHHITNDMVKDAPNWLNMNEQVWQIVHGRDVIVYNADYDFRLIEQSEKACEPFALSDWSTISRACAMNAYAEHVGDWNEYQDSYRWHKLVNAAANAGFQLPEDVKAHSALGDCLMTLAVCRYLVDSDQ